MEIVYFPSAQSALLRISEYGRDHFGERLAQDFLKRFVEQVEILKTFSEMGGVYETDHDELQDVTLRRFVFEGHQVFYEVLTAKIRIYSIIAKGEPLENILG